MVGFSHERPRGYCYADAYPQKARLRGTDGVVLQNGQLRPFSTQVQKPLKHTTTFTNRFSFAAMQVHQFFNATIKIHLNHLKSRERVNAGTTIEMGNWAIILYVQISVLET
jgi:hypothetical protein